MRQVERILSEFVVACTTRAGTDLEATIFNNEVLYRKRVCWEGGGV
jgi:hypothetical protein